MLADQQVDINRQKHKQELHARLIEIQNECKRLTGLEKRVENTSVAEGEGNNIQDRDVDAECSLLEALKKEESDTLKKIAAFETEQRVLVELEERQQALQRQREIETTGIHVTHEGPLTPRLQKVGANMSVHGALCLPRLLLRSN